MKGRWKGIQCQEPYHKCRKSKTSVNHMMLHVYFMQRNNFKLTQATRQCIKLTKSFFGAHILKLCRKINYLHIFICHYSFLSEVETVLPRSTLLYSRIHILHIIKTQLLLNFNPSASLYLKTEM